MTRTPPYATSRSSAVTVPIAYAAGSVLICSSARSTAAPVHVGHSSGKMVMTRKATKKAQTSIDLLDAAKKVLRQNGYAKLSTRQVAAAGIKALTLLCDVLDKAVLLSQRVKKAQRPDDYSYVWRPAIELSWHTVDDLLGVLVSAVRDAAEQSCRQDLATVPEIVRYLESRAWRVFHRIALHLVKLFAGASPDLVSERRGESERFDRMDFHHEYNLLAKECFSSLNLENKARILNWILKGPDINLRVWIQPMCRGGPWPSGPSGSVR